MLKLKVKVDKTNSHNTKILYKPPESSPFVKTITRIFLPQANKIQLP